MVNSGKRRVVLFVGPLISLFWTSGDVCTGFQSRHGSPGLHALLLCNEIFRFISGTTPADLLVAIIAANLFSSTYLWTTIGGDQDWDLSCISLSHSVRPGRRSTDLEILCIAIRLPMQVRQRISHTILPKHVMHSEILVCQILGWCGWCSLSALVQTIPSHYEVLRENIVISLIKYYTILANWHSMNIFTARKRSLGQGNMFTRLSFCPHGGRGVWSWGGSGPGGIWSQGGAWSRGMPGPGGVPGPEGCLVETPPGRLLLRAVRILLECILV